MWMATMKINVLLEVSCLFWAPNGGSKLLFSPSRIRTIARKGEEEKNIYYRAGSLWRPLYIWKRIFSIGEFELLLFASWLQFGERDL